MANPKDDEDVINLFQAMTPEEQNKMSPDEMKYISDAMDRSLQAKAANPKVQQDWGDAKNSSTKTEAKPSYSRSVMDKLQKDSDANISGIRDSARTIANVATGGNAGRILSSDKALGGSGEDDKTEEEWNKIYNDAESRSPGTSIATSIALPGNKLVQSGFAASSAYNKSGGGDEGMISALKHGVGTYVGASAIDKAMPFIQKGLTKVAGPLLNKIGDRQLGEFLGIPEIEIGKLKASGELDDFINVLREKGILSSGQGRHESLMKGVNEAENVTGPALGEEVSKLPNMHNNELSQDFDRAANSQNMTGVQDNLSKKYLQKESERWANRPGMTGYDPNNNVAIEGGGPEWISGEPVSESMNAPHVTAGNPTNGVDAEPIWTPADHELTGPSDTVPRSGIAVPEVTAPHLHQERIAIDDRLYKGTLPAGGAIQTNEAQGLQDARQVYSDALERQAVKAGRLPEYSAANKLHSNVQTANSGLSAELKSTDRYGETHPFTKPGKVALEHARSAIGLGAKDLATAIKNNPNLMSKVNGGKISRIADVILQSQNPEVEDDIFTQTDPEWAREKLEIQKEMGNDNGN